MSKKSYTEGTWRSDRRFKALCKALAACKTEDQVADFLRDVGTLSELFAWAERWEVAQRLAKGETYRAIATVTGASTTTVTRVANFLNSGEGYKSVLNTHHHHHADSAPRGKRSASMVRKG